jgi:colicin import membrane protein
MATLANDPLRPRPPGGMRRGVTLALLVHLGLIVALAIGVRWRSSEPEGVSAELWAAVPQQAAPREVEAPPPPPPPQPKPVERAEPPPQQRDADIAIEKARKEKLAQERAEKEKAEKEKAQKEKEKAQREKAEREKTELAERKKKEEEERRLAKLRDENLKRLQGLAGATGEPSSTGSAQQSAGPSASYAGRIKARIKPHIVLLDDLPGNPTAEVEVRAAPDGTIIAKRIVKPSGSKEWDDAVLRAIDRTEVLPRDVDGRVPSPIVIAFRPRE